MSAGRDFFFSSVPLCDEPLSGNPTGPLYTDQYDQLYRNPNDPPYRNPSDPLYRNPSDPLYRNPSDPPYRNPNDLLNYCDSLLRPSAFRTTPGSLATNSLQDYGDHLHYQQQNLRDHQSSRQQSLRDPQDHVHQNIPQLNLQRPLGQSLRDPQDHVHQNIPQQNLQRPLGQSLRDPQDHVHQHIPQPNFQRPQNLEQPNIEHPIIIVLTNIEHQLNLVQQTIERSQRQLIEVSQKLQQIRITSNLPLRSRPVSYPNSNGGNNSTMDPNMFELLIDLKDYKSNVIKVAIKDGHMVVTAKPKFYIDEIDLTNRTFFQRYKIPDDVDFDKLIPCFNPNGVLAIRGPRKVVVSHKFPLDRVIPIRIEYPDDNIETKERPVPEFDSENVRNE